VIFKVEPCERTGSAPARFVHNRCVTRKQEIEKVLREKYGDHSEVFFSELAIASGVSIYDCKQVVKFHPVLTTAGAGHKAAPLVGQTFSEALVKVR
jgi:hypothetical protein